MVWGLWFVTLMARSLAARTIPIGNLTESVLSEAVAASQRGPGLVFAQEMGYRKVHIEGDSNQVIELTRERVDVNTAVVGILIAAI